MAATSLGNTRNICRKYYVHPFVESSYKDGSIEKVFNRIDPSDQLEDYFTNTEGAILKLLSDYTPTFLKNIKH
ncbi:hypothetical protein [Aquimarina sp. RZ0]|uniref:hypothetical protein n=1 Tax=Aquimarina sp. RZ0 TaxID=2607730 RepID=UPI0011F1F0FC|nr:hypothetical protein [Aquimarina sp. RZ0]KAA1242550.1 hypothetical protein F0000_25065 [Aquimarina sp. RZ0]